MNTKTHLLGGVFFRVVWTHDTMGNVTCVYTWHCAKCLQPYEHEKTRFASCRVSTTRGETTLSPTEIKRAVRIREDIYAGEPLCRVSNGWFDFIWRHNAEWVLHADLFSYTYIRFFWFHMETHHFLTCIHIWFDFRWNHTSFPIFKYLVPYSYIFSHIHICFEGEFHMETHMPQHTVSISFDFIWKHITEWVLFAYVFTFAYSQLIRFGFFFGYAPQRCVHTKRAIHMKRHIHTKKHIQDWIIGWRYLMKQMSRIRMKRHRHMKIDI